MQDGVQCLAAGANAFVSKPIELEIVAWYDCSESWNSSTLCANAIAIGLSNGYIFRRTRGGMAADFLIPRSGTRYGSGRARGLAH